MRENRPSGSMSGVWKRKRHYAATAPHLDSTHKIINEGSYAPCIMDVGFHGESSLRAGRVYPILEQSLGEKVLAHWRAK